MSSDRELLRTLTSGEQGGREGGTSAKNCCPGSPRYGGHPLLNLTLKATVPSWRTKGTESAQSGWTIRFQQPLWWQQEAWWKGPPETGVLLGQCGRQAGLDLEGTVRKNTGQVICGRWVIEPALNLSQKRD